MRTKLLCLVLCLTGCDETLQRMREQPKYLPYSENPLFGDRRAMRQPPEGTVPWEAQALAGQTVVGQKDGKYFERIPVPITEDLLGQGRKSFNIYCATCHGFLGDGSSLVATKMGVRPPPSLHVHDDPPGFIYEVISLGRGVMASYATELTPKDRWAVVAYIEALKKSQRASIQDVPEDVRAKLMQEARP